MTNKKTLIISVSALFIVVMVLVCYLFIRQRTGQVVQVPTTASPKEVAQTFLSALANGDKNTANAMLQAHILNDPQYRPYWDKVKGLKLISLGEPVVNPRHRGGWFVPYIARLNSGETLKERVSVRNDSPGKQWQVDGF